jgi:Z1 domain
MIITDGHYFAATIGALNLQPPQAAATTQNATSITNAVMRAYGIGADGNIEPARIPPRPVTGLVYGRIQSGKTRAMIASTAMAFDNRFKISVVMTSNINDLVSQTHIDFTLGIPGITTFTKDSDLTREVANTRMYLERGDGRLLIICSKGATSLRNISQFLRAIGANGFPTILFDDEGDQASLDTNTRRRSRTRGASVAPSTINDIIQNTLRRAVPKHVYVSVTGTPQAVLLQSADSTHRPSFIEMLPPGASYVGGNAFFNTDEPEDNQNLIVLVNPNEQRELLNRSRPIPSGLRQSILFFLVSASAALRILSRPERGYSYLCHPSLKNDEQEIAEDRISTFLTNIYDALLPGATGGAEILRDLRNAHATLATTLGARTPSFDLVVETIIQNLPTRRLLVINARVRRQGIQYGQGLNFLIGGNTLGRGIAIRDLLVTYYVRSTQISQIDTMHQHARMYGYRSNTLAYTRLFIPRHLYHRFRDIHHSDEDLRTFIEEHRAGLPTTFPVEFGYNLRATRQGVLDVGKIDTLRPGMQVFPNAIILPQVARAYRTILDQLRDHFGVNNGTPQTIEAAAGQGVLVSKDQAIALVNLIRTGSKNTWRDSTIADVIEKVTDAFEGQILLRFRTANRRIREGGSIPTGILSGDEVNTARITETPTLWIVAATASIESEEGMAGENFMYPTFVIPNAFPSLFMFNRGQ